MSELDLVATDDLIEAIQRRFDHSVFCGLKEMTGEADATDIRWRGHMVACAGMVQAANYKIMQAFDGCRQVADDEGTGVDE